MRSKYGHAATNTDLCALNVPPSQMIAKSAVVSSGPGRGALASGRLLGGFGTKMSEGPVRAVGVARPILDVSSLGLPMTRFGRAIIGNWLS